MARKLICLDTSIIIDYFRKKNKSSTKLFEPSKNYNFAVSVITKIEIMSGSTKEQVDFWKLFFKDIIVLSLDEAVADQASVLIKDLRKSNKIIELPDILIASTALVYNLSIATFNIKHFERVSELEILR